MKATTTRGKRGPGKDGSPPPGAPIGDGSGAWSAGLRDDGQAALVGTILAAMPHVDELMADLVAERLAPDARAVLAALERDEAARLALLRSIPDRDDGFSEALARYAALRRLGRAYGGGLWYTHRSGRTYLAAPDAGGAATFRVAREVKPADLRRALGRLDELARSLAGLAGLPPKKSRAPKEVPVTPEASRPPPPGEAARAKRAAPPRQPGARRRHAPVRPARQKPPDDVGATSGQE